MRRRAQRQQDFEAVKQTLFAAGVSTVKAAKAHEEMFTTTLEALSEAYEGLAIHQLPADDDDQTHAQVPPAGLAALVEALSAQRQTALDNQSYEDYVAAEEKLQQLDELAVQRLERQVRWLQAQRQLAELRRSPQDSAATDAPEWTEATLRQQYKTLAEVRKAFGLKARTWKAAVQQVNTSVDASDRDR